jgi:predicted  nucleic acid-binding Zn-ribbon protein
MKAIHLSRLNLYKLTTWVIENEKRLYDARVTREEVARQAEEALGFRVNVSHVNVIIQNHQLNITSTRSAPKTFLKSAWNKSTDERLEALGIELSGMQINIEELQDKLRRLTPW